MKDKNKVFIIADYFINKNKIDRKGPLTNKKIQKLLYYAQAWNLTLNNKKLFNDKIEAWIHGPAVPKVYFKFKDFGMRDINLDIDNKELNTLSKIEVELLDTIWKVYGKYDADYLELLTHNEDPWLKTRDSKQPYESSNDVISDEIMKEYYGKQLR